MNGFPSFEVLADFIPQFVWMCTPDGLNVYFNQRWVDYTGLSLEESYGRGWNTPFHPDDKQAAWDAWNHATGTGEPYRVESRLRAADGSYRWFLMRGEPLKDATGGVAYWFGSCTDINDLRLAQEALEQQTALLELAHDAIFVRGGKSEVTYWNRGAEELYGWTRQEAAGCVTHELLKTRFPRPLAEILAEVEVKGVWEGELVQARRDGLEIAVASRWAAQRADSGHILGILEINRDITKRKRAEEAQRQSEAEQRHQREFLESLLANTPYGVAVCQGPDLRFTLANQAYQAFVKREQLVGRTYRELFPEAAAAEAETRNVLETGEPWTVRRFKAPIPGKAEAIWEGKVVRLPITEGEEASVLALCWDVTEQALVEEALTRNRDHLSLAMQIAQAGSFDLDLTTRTASWSEELQRLYGIGPGKATVEMDEWAGWVVPEDRDRVEADFVAGIEAGGVTTQFRIRRRDNGEVRWIEGRGRVLRDETGVAVQMVGFSIDITAQKRAEEAAIQAFEQRRLALEASKMGAWDFHLDTGKVFWDDRCAEMYGTSPGENSAEAIIGRIHPDDQPAVREALASAQAPGSDGTYHSEHRVVWPDGTYHWITSHGRAFFAGSGAQRRAVRFAGVNIETTEEKRAEERLRQTQKLESLGLLAGGIAHDFNNLLVGVVGNASLAIDLIPPGHPAAELLNGVLKSGERAAHLTRQMLAYSGRGRFLVEPLDLSVLVPEMDGLVRPSIARRITLHYDLARGLPSVMADRGQVQQVFMNLVLNAADAIGSNAGLITVRTGVEEVDRHYTRLHPETAALADGKYVCLEVRDTGSGMDEATKAKIFEPFFTTRFVGRGLGLAAVDGILRGHKGGIVVTSAPGKGSCFTVLFPADAAERCPAERSNAPLRGTGVVLVVDDEQAVRKLAKRALERLGYTVLVAESGLAAIDVAKRHAGEIALVVLDLSMPQMSGEEVLRELRKLRPGVKVLVSSGYSESEALSPFDGQQVSGFIQKPYTLPGLAEKVATSLKG